MSADTCCAGCQREFSGREGGWHDTGRLWHTQCRNWSAVQRAPYGHLESPLRKLWQRTDPGPLRDEVATMGRWLTQARSQWPTQASVWLAEVRPRVDRLRARMRRAGVLELGF